MNDDDSDTIRRVLAGEREAFRPLVLRHQAAICATVRALLPRGCDWEDIAQDVFLTAFRHLTTFDSGKASFRTWLLTITRNRCHDVSRRLPKTKRASRTEPVDDRTPPALIAEAEWFDQLDAGLEQLPPEQRLVFTLIELQGLSYQETAEIADIHLGTVKSRLARAKASLRNVLAPLFPERTAATTR